MLDYLFPKARFRYLHVLPLPRPVPQNQAKPTIGGLPGRMEHGWDLVVFAVVMPAHNLDTLNGGWRAHPAVHEEVLCGASPQRRRRSKHLKGILVASDLGLPGRPIHGILVQQPPIPLHQICI